MLVNHACGASRGAGYRARASGFTEPTYLKHIVQVRQQDGEGPTGGPAHYEKERCRERQV